MSEMKFNDMIARLEAIVSTLEKGDCSLEDSLKLFEEGTSLAADCSAKLKAAEQKITELKQQSEAE